MSTEETSITSIDLSKEKDGGLLKTILKEGQNPNERPSSGDTVTVHYVGTLKDTGEKFDSSRDRNEPFVFTLGQGKVIKGWDLGVASMCRGELAQLECRADYAYGESGSPPKIPANATLIFEVELISWEGEDLSPDLDRTITRTIIVPGEKYNCPNERAPVKVHAVGTDLNGRVFYDHDLEYEMGEGSEHLLPDGVDKALRRMNKGEKCRLTLKGRFGYGAQPPPEFGLAPYESIVFTLFLKDFDKLKASWELLDEEKLEQAQKFKERGTKFYSQGKYRLALDKYNAIVSLLEFAKPSKADEEGGKELAEKYGEMLVAAWLNSALASQKLGEMAEVIKCCDKVLEKRPDNVKAIYRKAQALQSRKDFDEAIDEYRRVLELEPDNKAAVQQIHECRQHLAMLLERERKKYRGMFDRMAKEEQEAEPQQPKPVGEVA